MLTTEQKAVILRKTGFTVPDAPTAGGGDAEATATQQWGAQIESMFVTYVAARAAKSLRDAEETRQMQLLRQSAAPRSRGRFQFQRV
ncbi:MAG: hypothetical protein EOP81_14525 [Variovorax sp.]|nr:MAG: hypothetical protein EOP81_14525 [Variovorax sp.]